MEASQLVERADGIFCGIGSQMDINQCGIQGFVPHEFFNSELVCAVFVKLCPESKTERMAGQAGIPSKGSTVSCELVGKGCGRIRSIILIVSGKEPFRWAAAFKPVPGEQFQRPVGEEGITVGAFS